MKTKRLWSFLLVVCMLLSLVPGAAFAQEGTETSAATAWAAERIDALSVEEMGEGVIYFGTTATRAEERGRYLLTLYRDGYTEEEATIELHTVDVSAKVKEDYQILNQETVYNEVDGTVLERNANYDALESIEKYQDTLAEIQGQQAEEEGAEPENEEVESPAQTSSLAAIKEAQTGIPTRATTSSGSLALVQQELSEEEQAYTAELNKETAENLGDYVASSSTSVLTFAPGQTELQVEIAVLEDEEPEAEELVMLLLSAPEGARLGDLKTATVIIEDDEEKEPAYVGFSAASYRLSEDSSVALVRTGAAYQAVSVEVCLDNAKQTVLFKPYETEKEIPLTMQGSGSAKLTLGNFQGCEKGDYTEATVTFGEMEIPEEYRLTPSSENASGSPSLTLAASNTKSFYLTDIKSHNGKSQLRVDYVPGQKDEEGHLYGKIWDEGYNPEVHVGNYIFASSFQYGLNEGKIHKWESSHQSSTDTNEPDGYGKLYYYYWVTGKKGASYARLNNMNHMLYQYYAVDWHQTRTAYGGQTSRFAVRDGSKNNIVTRTIDGDFSRKQTSITALKNQMPQAKGNYIDILAEDSNKNRTPKIEVHFGGIAAMFRTFNIAIAQPVKLSFKNTESNVPCNVSLAEGHSLRYTGQSLQIKQNASQQNGIINGELIGYKIETNYKSTENSQKKTFYYMAKGVHPNQAAGTTYSSGNIYYADKGTNLSSIDFDNKFITDIINPNLLSVNASEGNDTDWDTDLRFTPLYRYKDAKVQILSAEGGSFSGLTAGSKTTYHFGDVLKLSGIPASDAWVYAGYHVTARATDNTNETPLIDQTVWTDTGTEQTLILGEKNCTFYQIQPVFKKKQGNYIMLNNQAGDKLTFMNVLSKDELKVLAKAYPDYGFNENQLIYVCEPTATGKTDAEKLLNQITAKPGAIYQIQAYGKEEGDSYYKPVFYNQYFSEQKITSYVLDYVASADLEENIITVTATKRSANDEGYMQLDGQIVSQGYTIRQSAEYTESSPVEGLSVYAGSRKRAAMWVTMSGSTTPTKIQTVERPNTTTDENGYFSLSGLRANTKDSITLWYSDGTIEGVKVINLAEVSGTSGEMSFVTGETDDAAKKNTETVVSQNGTLYDLTKSSSYSTIETPIFTVGAPYPTEVNYTYDSGANTEKFGTMGNSIAIMDDYLKVTLKVNRQGRQIKKAVFTVDKQRSADATYTIEGKINQDTFICDFGGKNMKDIFEPGDRIYVTLYDAEETVVYFSATDGNGNDTYTSQTQETKYAKVYTGLSFYVPMLEAVLQSYEVPNGLSADLPVLGPAMGSSGSGVLSFTKQNWTGDVPGYSLIFDANINAWNKNNLSNSAQGTLSNVRKMKNSASQQAKGLVNGMDDVMHDWGIADPKETKKLKDSIYKRSLNDSLSKTKLNLNVIVLLNLEFVFSEESGEYVFYGAQFAIGGTFAVARTFYTVVNGFPLFLQLSGNLGAQIQVNHEEAVNLTASQFSTYENIYDAMDKDTDAGLLGYFGFKIQAGVGVCGVLSARGILAGNVTFFTAFKKPEEFEKESGILATIKGGIGFDLLLVSMEFYVGFTSGGGIYEDQTGMIVPGVSSLALSGASDNVEVRTYNMGGGSQVGEATTLHLAADAGTGTTYQVLIDNAPERTKPQVVTLADGRKLLVYIGASGARSENLNKPCLYYSVCDTNGTWSNAQPIEEDGTADGTPTLAVYGNDVLVAWADAASPFTDEEITGGKYKEMLEEFDISASRFSGTTGTFGDILQVTADEANHEGAKFMDYSPVLCADQEGQLGVAVFYIKKDIRTAVSDSDLAAPNAVYETIALTVVNKDNEVLAEQFLPIEGDPLMMDLDGALTKLTLDGEEHAFAICTYTVDGDNNFQSSNDWDTYLLFHDITANKTYEPINLCNDFVSDTKPELTRIGSEIYLTYVTQKQDSSQEQAVSELKFMSVTDMLQEMQHGIMDDEANTNAWNIDMGTVLADSAEGRAWYQKTAAELGLNKHEYEGSIYEELYNDQFPVNATEIWLEDNQSAAVGEYQLTVGKDGRVYLFWIDSGSTDADDYSIELYGMVKTVEAEDTEASGWSKPVRLTRFSDVVENAAIDEFTVAVDENGAISLISNMYKQNLVDGEVAYSDHKMIAFNVNTGGRPDIVKEDDTDDGISYSADYPQSGAETEVSVDVKNDGLLPVKLQDAQVQIGDQVGNVTLGDTLLGGETKTVTAKVTMPEEVSPTTTASVMVRMQEDTTVTAEGTVPCGALLQFEGQGVSLNEDGKVVYTVAITNNGNQPTGAMTLDAQRTENGGGLVGSVTTQSAESIDPGATKECSLVVNADTLALKDFGKYGVSDLSLTAKSGDSVIGSTVERVTAKAFAQKLLADGSFNNLTVTAGTSKALRLSGGVTLANAEFEFSSADEKVAYVDENGYLVGVSAGETTITVTEKNSGVTVKFTVKVEAAKTEDKEEQLNGNNNLSYSGAISRSMIFASGDDTAEDTGLPFVDVHEGDWFYDGVSYTYHNGLFKGATDTTFEPETPITRGMLVTVLGRKENVAETAPEASSFTDVDSAEYYASYINWAAENKIVEGYGDGTFGPNDLLTREQMAAIIFRYMTYKGKAPEGAWAVRLPYSDLEELSEYAAEPVMYCYKEGIMTGKEDNRFDPQGNATRGETATILMRSFQ